LPPPAPAKAADRGRGARLEYWLAVIALAAASNVLRPAVEAQPRIAAPKTTALANGRAVTVPVSLTFMVSVCLADFEYSIGCRERSSLEAAHRLEQIFLDDYATGSAAGTLGIWFAVKAEPSEQTSFLHEVENRAIESVFRKLKEDADQRVAAAAGSADAQGGAAETAREFAQDIQRWHDDAGAEARSGVNWSHNWAGRSHTYKPGQALRDLARIGNLNRQNNQD
jgi:hypothetical protein